jgi:hypothetical protein
VVEERRMTARECPVWFRRFIKVLLSGSRRIGPRHDELGKVSTRQSRLGKTIATTLSFQYSCTSIWQLPGSDSFLALALIKRIHDSHEILLLTVLTRQQSSLVSGIQYRRYLAAQRMQSADSNSHSSEASTTTYPTLSLASSLRPMKNATL